MTDTKQHPKTIAGIEIVEVRNVNAEFRFYLRPEGGDQYVAAFNRKEDAEAFADRQERIEALEAFLDKVVHQANHATSPANLVLMRLAHQAGRLYHNEQPTAAEETR